MMTKAMMTNKQYEHLGRALVCEAKLEVAREALDSLCNELSLHLGALAGSEAANAWIKNQYGKNLAMFNGCRDFMAAALAAALREAVGERTGKMERKVIKVARDLEEVSK